MIPLSNALIYLKCNTCGGLRILNREEVLISKIIIEDFIISHDACDKSKIEFYIVSKHFCKMYNYDSNDREYFKRRNPLFEGGLCD